MRSIVLVLSALATVFCLSAAGVQTGSPVFLPLVLGPAAYPSPTVDPSPTASPSPTADPSPTAAPSLEAEVLALINGERTARGLAPLVLDALLEEAAVAHSEDMATNDFCGHIGSDGSDPVDRLARVGYTWSICGEVVAAGQDNAAAVVAAWMASDGHRAALLSAAFTALGIGHSRCEGSGYLHYWAVDLATP